MGIPRLWVSAHRKGLNKALGAAFDFFATIGSSLRKILPGETGGPGLAGGELPPRSPVGNCYTYSTDCYLSLAVSKLSGWRNFVISCFFVAKFSL